jgi:hypothetical protein
MEEMGGMRRVMSLWREQAREYLQQMTSPHENVLVINYNQWHSDLSYRKCLAQKLRVNALREHHRDAVNGYGFGSSFDGVEFHGRASSMDTASRWRSVESDEIFMDALSEDLEAHYLATQIFGDLIGSDAVPEWLAKSIAASRAHYSDSSAPSQGFPAKVGIEFRHGLGDSVYFALQIPLYRARGYQITVACNPDRNLLYRAAGADVRKEKGTFPTARWRHPPNMKDSGAIYAEHFNKAAHNFSLAPLPGIGVPDELWKEYCAVRLPILEQISAEDWAMVDSYVGGLAKPLILLHTVGNSFQKSKSIPATMTSELYSHLLDGCEGTLILLDWDNRVQKHDSPRVRHLTDHWQKLTISQLAALLTRADLLIGIDSGPFHLAGALDVTSLGVFLDPGHHPARYCLPRTCQACLITSDSHPLVSRALRKEFNLLAERKLDAVAIGRHALRMLQKTRYLCGQHKGEDLMLQHWVMDLCRGGMGKLGVRMNRDIGFDILLREAAARFCRPMIVETGCIRVPEDWSGAGYSTMVLGAFAQYTEGHLRSIDVDPKHCEFARQECYGWEAIEIVQGEGRSVLPSLDGLIDVLALDSMDTENPDCAKNAFAELQAALPMLHAMSLVIFDDTIVVDGKCRGLGAKAVPWMLDRGWKVLHAGYQTILSRTPSISSTIPKQTV